MIMNIPIHTTKLHNIRIHYILDIATQFLAEGEIVFITGVDE